MFDISQQMEVFPTTVDLKRIDPSLNMRRFYRMSVQPDLFGGACPCAGMGPYRVSRADANRTAPGRGACCDRPIEARSDEASPRILTF